METLNGSVSISIPLFLRCRLCGFTTVLLFICVQTSYELAFPMLAEEVGFEPTGQIKAGTTDFKSVRLCPLAHSSIRCRGSRTLRSLIQRYLRLLRFSFMALPITRYIIWRNVHQQLHSLLRDFHLLYRGCYDSWQRGWDLNPYTEKARLLVV